MSIRTMPGTIVYRGQADQDVTHSDALLFNVFLYSYTTRENCQKICQTQV